MNDKAPVFQAFETEDGKPLQKLPAQICLETGEWRIFWQGMQMAFQEVDYLKEERLGCSRGRALFMVDQYQVVYE